MSLKIYAPLLTFATKHGRYLRKMDKRKRSDASGSAGRKQLYVSVHVQDLVYKEEDLEE